MENQSSLNMTCLHIYIFQHINLLVKMLMCCLFVDIDECSSDTCMNGGTCTGDVNSYSCTCVPGYTGEDCEIGM